MMTLAMRFERRRVRGSGCWAWVGATRQGYGVIGRGGRSEGLVYAHRLAWELAYGPVPAGMCVLHRCDNRPCTNPDHLWLGSRGDNNRDMVAKGRHVGTRRLTAAQVREIRLSPDSARTLAGRFGVSPSAIYQVRSRRNWGHVA